MSQIDQFRFVFIVDYSWWIYFFFFSFEKISPSFPFQKNKKVNFWNLNKYAAVFSNVSCLIKLYCKVKSPMYRNKHSDLTMKKGTDQTNSSQLLSKQTSPTHHKGLVQSSSRASLTKSQSTFSSPVKQPLASPKSKPSLNHLSSDRKQYYKMSFVYS